MKKIELRQWERYFKAREMGLGVEAAAKKAHLSPATAYRFERGDQSSSGLEAASILGIDRVAGNLVDKPLSPEALRALEDFAFFRLRYFGRKSTPWQERAAYDVLRAMETPTVNTSSSTAPGSGKSTLFTHDIACWLIARDRTIRLQIGSRTERQARMYVGRIKKSLERDAPMRADAESLTLGIAFDAVATLQDDYGAFRPEGRSDLWRAEALVVRQTDGVSLDDKEPTVSAWGRDSGFLGGRFDLVLWDDLVDRKNSKTIESRESLIEWWGTEAETRVEPGGALILQGQRIGAFDLYKYALDLRNLDETPKYRHIRYQAHDETVCKGEHGTDAKAWPDGCLLDPHRLPWKMLETLKVNNPRVFQVQYQQEDGAALGGLVDPAWITGDVDNDGYPAPGCLDKERAMGEVPAHLTDGSGWSFVTVDPSPPSGGDHLVGLRPGHEQPLHRRHHPSPPVRPAVPLPRPGYVRLLRGVRGPPAEVGGGRGTDPGHRRRGERRPAVAAPAAAHPEVAGRHRHPVHPAHDHGEQVRPEVRRRVRRGLPPPGPHPHPARQPVEPPEGRAVHHRAHQLPRR